MAHVTELIATDESTDPDSQETVRVNEKPFHLENYAYRLRGLIDEAQSKGWAIDLIDECLYVGAYSREMMPAAPFVFRAWLQGVHVADWNLTANLLDSMIHPLALPLFLRGLKVEQVFDLLFGRVAVLLALDFEKFMELARKSGVSIRWSTRKEAAKIKGDFGAVRVQNRVPVVELGGHGVMAVGDGVIFRIIFHETTPAAAISALGRTPETLLRGEQDKAGSQP